MEYPRDRPHPDEGLLGSDLYFDPCFGRFDLRNLERSAHREAHGRQQISPEVHSCSQEVLRGGTQRLARDWFGKHITNRLSQAVRIASPDYAAS